MGFSNERMRTAQLAGWFLLEGIELTPAGNPITQPQELPFGVDHLIGFNELLTCKHPESAGVHFFLDDYQFERFWRQPQRYLAALAKCPLVIGPDFSLYTDFPAPLQRWNHYRNQLLTAWLQQQGVCAIPAAGWADDASFDWCFDGISPGGAVAVSTVGCLMTSTATPPTSSPRSSRHTASTSLPRSSTGGASRRCLPPCRRIPGCSRS